MDFLAYAVGVNAAVLWLALAVILLIIEIFSPIGLFVPFSVAALGVAAKVYFGPELKFWGGLFDDVLFLGLGLILIVPFRSVLRRYLDRTPNINDL